MSDQVEKSGEEIQSKGRLYYALQILGVFFQVFLAGLAGFLAASNEISKKEQRNVERRRELGLDPHKPSPYDE